MDNDLCNKIVTLLYFVDVKQIIIAHMKMKSRVWMLKQDEMMVTFMEA